MRRAARIDDNHNEIVAALRQIGASVQSLASVGGGVPDVLVGYRERNIILEIKDGSKPPSRRRLTDAEAKWHSEWKGQVATVNSVEEAIQVVSQIGREWV